MGIELIFALLIFIFIPITNGSFRKLFSTQLRSKWALFVVLAGLIIIDFAPIPKSRYDDLGIVILMATYVLLIGFIFANISIKGIWIALVGIVSNATVIALNFGMPVNATKDFTVVESIKHQSSTPNDLLVFLSDIITIKPLKMSISIGDIIFGFGMMLACFFLSRKDKKSSSVVEEEFELEEIIDENFAQREELVVEEKEPASQPVLFRIESEFVPKTTMENDLEFLEQVQVLESQNQHNTETEKENYVVIAAAAEAITIDLNQENANEEVEKRKYKGSSHKKFHRNNVGIAALPTKEELGYSADSMEIINAAE